ncbi:MAG: hypothetical protein RLZZ587_1053 [Actinomycetota bacterium]|jgi:hypothetical protein
MLSSRSALGIASATLVFTMVAATPALAAGTVANSDFEADAVGATDITSWSEYTELVDLGVTELGGCTTVDTSNYSTLRDWDAAVDDNSGVNTGVDPVEAGDNLASSADITAGDAPSFEVEIVDGASIEDATDVDDNAVVLQTTGNVANLRSDMSTEGEDEETGIVGYVIHGPAIVSSEFTAAPGNTIDVEWAASGDSDDFHVFGYIVNTDTCEQTEVLDATGLSQEWITTSAEVTDSASYRFVFVAGTYDQSWGGAAGGVLYVQEVSVGGLAETGFESSELAVTAGALVLAGAFATAGIRVARRRAS